MADDNGRVPTPIRVVKEWTVQTSPWTVVDGRVVFAKNAAEPKRTERRAFAVYPDGADDRMLAYALWAKEFSEALTDDTALTVGLRSVGVVEHEHGPHCADIIRRGDEHGDLGDWLIVFDE